MPYDENDAIDYQVLAHEVDYVYAAGCQGITLALVSETLRLTPDERLEVVRFLGQCNDRRGAFVVSVGAESSAAAACHARAAHEAGATALMAIPPLHVAPPESELRGYFEAILHATPLPLIVQDASAYLGKPLSNEFQAVLQNDWGERVGFKPEGAPVGHAITAINALTENRAAIYEGSGGGQLVENYRRGITGTMPGVDLCRAVVRLWQALEQGDEDTIYAIGPLLGAMLGIVTGLDGYLALEKLLMCRHGVFCNERVRGPRGFTLDEIARAEIERCYARIESVMAR
jgi:4-hydroxy-tetrahydrodipicolinate synthase